MITIDPYRWSENGNCCVNIKVKIITAKNDRHPIRNLRSKVGVVFRGWIDSHS